MTAARALWLTAALVAAAPVSAEAQTDRSVALFDEGVEHLRASAFEAAADAFRESYRLAPRVTTMCNLALTYDRWGERRERAVRAYRTCARDDDTGRFGSFAERRVREIEREIALAEEARPAPTEPETTAPAPTLLETAAPAPETPPADHTLLGVGIGVTAVAAGAFAVGLVFALDAQATVDDLQRQLGPSPTIVRGSDAHRRLGGAEDAATAATALYVGAAIGAAAGATLIIIDLVTADEPDRASARVRPTGLGLQLEGRM